ncbi:MAG: hypothetical protein Q8P18_32570 [Pseudomonadota bacterium]|nr:hypothetical protein [Pseudomonadota bacterium]
MRRILFLDLDDTVFQSRRKTTDVAAVPVGVGSDGAPDTLMTGRQRALFDWLTEGAQVVPTTGRSVAALRRVALPFDGWAICSFGGVVLTPEGVPEPRWHARAEAGAERCRDALTALVSHVEQESARLSGAGPSVTVRVRIIEDAGLPMYLSAKSPHGDASAVARLVPGVRAACPPGWRLHWNDNNLAVLPDWLGKEHAVRWFREVLLDEDVVAIGAGDSHSDAPFLGACDYALAPIGSQLWRGLLGGAASGLAGTGAAR